VSNIPFEPKTPCAWEFYHRLLGYLVWGGQLIQIRINSISNIDLMIGYGSNMQNLAMNVTNENLTLDYWYTLTVDQYALVVAVPNAD